MPYFDEPVTTPLDQASVSDLIERFEVTRLRYVIADLDTERITTDRLLTADEVGESRIQKTDSRKIHTVILG